VKKHISKLTKPLRTKSFSSSRFSRANLTIFGIVFAAIGGYIIYSSFAATPTVANIWVDTTTSGNTCVRSASPAAYDTNKACSTFDAAWDAATAGDTIVVKAGSYGPQEVTGNKTTDTKIIGEDGVTIGGRTMQCQAVFGGDSAFCTEGSHLWLENITIDSGSDTGIGAGTRIWPGVDNVTFKNVDVVGDFGVVNVQGDSFKWLGGMLGDDLPAAQQPAMTCFNGAWLPLTLEPSGNWTATTGAVIDGIKFNPRRISGMTPNQGTCGADGVPHVETIRPNSSGADNWTVKNSWFVEGSDAGSGHIFASTDVSGAKIINNYFAPTLGSTWAQMGNTTGFTVAYNTFTQSGVFAGGQTGFTWVGNLGPSSASGCSGTHIKNVWSGTGSCGSDTFVGSTSLGINSDGHLASTSPAINAAETDTASDYCTGAIVGSVDFDGGTRPQGAACDAGADEFGATGGGGPVANLWVDTNGGTCTRSTTQAAYNDTAACASLDAAYNAASAGDTIIVKAGTYSTTQSIANRTALASGAPVIIKSASGETVNFGSISVDTSKITLQGPSFNVRSFDVGNAGDSTLRRTDITFDNLNVDAQDTLNTDAIWAGNTTNFKILNSKVGNTMAGSGASETAKSVMTCAANSTCHNINMDFENNLFYDADTASGSAAHLECIWAGGIQGFILRNNTFRDCTYFDVFVTVVLANNQPQPKDLLFENNLFGQTVHPDGSNFGFALSLHGDVSPNNFIYRNNTIEGAIVQAADGNPIGAGGWQITGNIIAGGVQLADSLGMGCRSGVTFNYNVMPISCGTNTTVATSADIRAGWVSPKVPYAGADDFHLLSTSVAINKGNPASAGTTDFDGVARANPPDAGAFEFTGSVTPPTPPPPAPPPPAPPTPPAPPGTQLVGNNVVEGLADSLASGQTEAWPFTATGTGTAATAALYLDSSSTASGVLLGLYSDSSGAPGTLLATATISSPVSGWNSATFGSPPSITNGTNYWIAILGTGTGQVVIRDRGTGGTCNARVNAAPNNWTSLHNPFGSLDPTLFAQCPISAYIVAASSGGTKVGDLNADNLVNIFDLSIMLSKYNTTNATADLNSDGTVNIFDLSILLSHYGS
jgi:hypothetical protein